MKYFVKLFNIFAQIMMVSEFSTMPVLKIRVEMLMVKFEHGVAINKS